MRYMILAVLASGAFFAINYALTQQERQECYQWRAQLNRASNTQKMAIAEDWQTWQDEQCKALAVNVF